MKKIAEKKVIFIFIGALLVGFAGTFLYLSQTSKPKKDENKQGETKTDENVVTQKEKGAGLENTNTTAAPKAAVNEAPPANTSSLGSLAASVTAQKSYSDDSISILFYLEGAGAFTLQEKVGGSWQTTMENVNYAGRGGLEAGTLAPGQDTKTLRVMKIENGKYSAITKEFTVNRAEVLSSLGIKTYN